MERLIKRLIISLFPELKNRFHAPRLGRVVNVNAGDGTDTTSTSAEPVHCVDIQPLDRDLKDIGPILRDVTVSLPYAGNHRGFFGLPQKDSIIEFTFSYFMPNLIHIRGTLPWSLTIPNVGANQSKWMHSQQCYQQYTENGDWDQLGRINQIAADMKNQMKAPKTWIGSEDTNTLRLLSQFMQDTADALNTLSTHTHLPSGLPAQEGAVADKASSVLDTKRKLDGITE